MSVEIGVPLTSLSIEMIAQKNGIGRLMRLLPKEHIGFLRHEVSFPRVALFARGNEVRPRVLSSPCPGYDMVDGQLFPRAAILAFVVIALENILPCKINALVRGVNISVEANDRRHRKAIRDGPQFMAIGRPDEFTFFEVDENERAFHGAHHERAEILIEYQYPCVHDCKIKPIFELTKRE